MIERNIMPEKTKRGLVRTSLFIDPEMLKKLKKLAEKEERSIAGLIRHAINEHIKKSSK